MRAAGCALFVLVLYAVSNYRCVNGIPPVMTTVGGIEVYQFFVDFFSGIEDFYNLVDRMSDMSRRIVSFERNSKVLPVTATVGGIRKLDEIAKEIGEFTSISDIDKLMDGMMDVSRKIDSFERHSEVLITMGFENLRQELHTQTQLSNQFQILTDQLHMISGEYRRLKHYANMTMEFRKFTLNNFAANRVIPDDSGVPETLEKLHSLVLPSKDGHKNQNFLKLIADHLKGNINTTQCSDKQSHQYLLYDLLNPILIAEIKGLAIMQFSYKLLALYGRGNFSKELQDTETGYQTRLSETLDAFRTAMSIASPDVWRCDPPVWIGSSTCTEEYESYTGLALHYNYDFNKWNVVADVGSNKVVTGIRIIRRFNSVFFEIEQGELLPEGMIKANTTEWTDPNVYFIGQRLQEEGIDYIQVLPDTQKVGIELNDVAAPPGHCLTGVRFTKRDSNLGLEIMTTPFDFATGRLIDPLTTSQWHGYDGTTPKTAVALTNPDESTLSRLPSIPNFGINQYVIFTPLEKKIGESEKMVPFIDTQPVFPFPRVVLAGAGIFYKGRDGYGGFIAPKLMTYNLGPHLRH